MDEDDIRRRAESKITYIGNVMRPDFSDLLKTLPGALRAVKYLLAVGKLKYAGKVVTPDFSDLVKGIDAVIKAVDYLLSINSSVKVDAGNKQLVIAELKDYLDTINDAKEQLDIVYNNLGEGFTVDPAWFCWLGDNGIQFIKLYNKLINSSNREQLIRRLGDDTLISSIINGINKINDRIDGINVRGGLSIERIPVMQA